MIYEEALANLVEKAKDNSKEGEDAFAKLARKKESHCLYIAYQVTGRYITKSDEEWSITLLALHEAVKKYVPGKGGFTAFADLVIRRRLIDFIRSQVARRETATDFDHFDERLLHEGTSMEEMKAMLRLEIEELTDRLKNYGVSFGELVDVSPKARKTRRACGKIINVMMDHQELILLMRKTKSLPGKKIEEYSSVPQKIIDRHRKYIIAAVEISAGDFPYLQEYLKEIRKEGRR